METAHTEFRVGWRHILAALLIVGLAFVLRVLVLLARAEIDPSFIPAYQTDPEVYLRFARGLLEGTFPYRPYVNQPGISYLLGSLMAIIGDNIPALHLAVAGLDSITAGVLIAGGWLLSRQAWGGLIAGLVFALYPVSIFYGTTFLIAPQAALILAMFFWLMLWQRESLAMWKSLMMGVVIGLLVIFRSNLAPLAVLYVLWLVMQATGWRAWLMHVSVTVIVSVMLIAPFTLWNIQAGSLQIMAQNSPQTLYSGNNRDASGMGSTSPAMMMAEDDEDWSEAIVRDIELDPVRYAGLMLRKGSVLWSSVEPGNIHNIGILQAQIAVLAIPVGFGGLALIALIGLMVLYYEDRALATFFVLAFAWLTVSLMLSFAISRLKYPAIVPVILLVTYALVIGIPRLLSQIHDPRLMVRRYALPGALIAGVMLLPFYAMGGDPPPVPPKRQYTELPPDAIPLDYTFGDRLRLVGWRAFPDYWRVPVRGWGETGESVVVELFWSILEPVERDYSFFIAFIADETRHAGFDRTLGGVSFPEKGTSLWEPGEIYGEIVGFRLDERVPTLTSGEITVGVYHRDGNEQDGYGPLEPLNMTAPVPDGRAIVGTVGVYPRRPAPEPDTITPANALVFGFPGEQLTLTGYSLPETVAPGETFTLDMTWEAQTPVQGDYTLFVHVMDSDNQLASQADSRPHPTLFTSNWRVDYALRHALTIQAPDEPGTYTVYFGLVDPQVDQRVPVDAPDYRPSAGTIRVEAD